MGMIRHKMYSIKDIVKEKREWCGKFDDYPYEYWKKRWDFLCDKLTKYSDMQYSMKPRIYHPALKKEPKNNV